MKWISVADRLPMPDEEVLLFVKDQIIKGKYILDAARGDDIYEDIPGWKGDGCGCCPKIEYNSPVTHWMPLPPKPE